MNFGKPEGQKTSVNHLLAVIITTVACFISSYFMILSGDVGGIVPIWPSIGVGLVCVLYFGPVALTGIFLGNFLSYLLMVTVNPLFESDILQFSWVLSLSLTTALQAGLGLYLINKNDLFPQKFRFPRKITLFYIYGAIIPSVISATLGNLAYVFFLDVRQDTFLINWLLWWAGDAASVFIFGTFLIVVKEFGSKRKRLVLLALSISFFSSIGINSLGITRDQERLNFIFEQQAVAISTAISEKKEVYMMLLLNLNSFVNSQINLTKLEMGQFTESIFDNYPIIKRIATLKRVEENDIEAFERRLTIEHGRDIVVNKVDDNHDEHFYVEFFEPSMSNPDIIGIDISVNNSLKEAYTYAINNRTHGMANPEVAPIIQSTPVTTMFYPDIREGNAVGLTLLTIDIHSLVDDVYNSAMDNGIYFYISDVDINGNENMAFQHDMPYDLNGEFRKYQIPLFNRTWVVSALYGQAFADKHATPEPYYIGVGGIIIASLIAFGVMVLSGQRQYLEYEVKIRTEQLEVANRSKSEFLANMSHDLRTPLNAILGFSEIMNKKMFGEIGLKKYEDYIRDIFNSSEYLLSLINDILDFSTIEAGGRDLKYEKVDLRLIAEDCLQNLSSLSELKELKCTVEAEDDLPLIMADRRALKQIFINLLSNSIKFTDVSGNITILLKSAGNEVVLSVVDTGIGIPESDMDRILDPFNRVENNPLVSHEGTGLGLAIVNSLVQLHGGKLSIISEVNHGTTVNIIWPIKPI